MKRLGVWTVVLDQELGPAQQRNLQEAIGVQVVDRTMLILQIFEQRARTREAKLQVKLAQMQYMLPRLQTFMTTGAGMDATGGGARGGSGNFLKGSGETQLETDRRLYWPEDTIQKTYTIVNFFGPLFFSSCPNYQLF